MVVVCGQRHYSDVSPPPISSSHSPIHRCGSLISNALSLVSVRLSFTSRLLKFVTGTRTMLLHLDDRPWDHPLITGVKKKFRLDDDFLPLFDSQLHVHEDGAPSRDDASLYRPDPPFLFGAVKVTISSVRCTALGTTRRVRFFLFARFQYSIRDSSASGKDAGRTIEMNAPVSKSASASGWAALNSGANWTDGRRGGICGFNGPTVAGTYPTRRKR